MVRVEEVNRAVQSARGPPRVVISEGDEGSGHSGDANIAGDCAMIARKLDEFYFWKVSSHLVRCPVG
jgi:hypothetical protein